MTATKGPRWPTTGRLARRRSVLGVVFTLAGPHEWQFPGGVFVARWDEHARAWEVSRMDGQPEWFGDTIAEPGDPAPHPVTSDYCYTRTLESAIKLLRRLGHLPERTTP